MQDQPEPNSELESAGEAIAPDYRKILGTISGVTVRELALLFCGVDPWADRSNRGLPREVQRNRDRLLAMLAKATGDRFRAAGHCDLDSDGGLRAQLVIHGKHPKPEVGWLEQYELDELDSVDEPSPDSVTVLLAEGVQWAVNNDIEIPWDLRRESWLAGLLSGGKRPTESELAIFDEFSSGPKTWDTLSDRFTGGPHDFSPRTLDGILARLMGYGLIRKRPREGYFRIDHPPEPTS